VLSGGSVVQTLLLQAANPGKAQHMHAVPGARYVVGGTQPAMAAEDIIVKRVGKNLRLDKASESADQQTLIIEDFFGSRAQLFGVGADGMYRPYVAAVDAVIDHASVAMETDAAVLQLASTPSMALSSADLMLADNAPLVAVAKVNAGVAPLADVSVATEEAVVAVAVDEAVNAVAVDEAVVAAILPVLPAEAVVEVSEVGPAVEAVQHVEIAAAVVVQTTHVEMPAEATVANAAQEAVETQQVGSAADVVVAAVSSGDAAVAVIDALLDDQGVVQGKIANGGFTDDGRPQIVGQAESGVLVHIYNGAELIGRTVAGANGDWSFVPRLPLADGRHVITVMYEYTDGEVSDVSAPYVIVVDKVVPDIPVISGMEDDQGRIKGQIVNGSFTDDSRPTIDGSAEPFATIVIYDKGHELGRTQAGADGKWKYTPDVALADGLHILDYAAIDRAGNLSEKTRATEFTVDTRPELVDIYAADDDVGVLKGTVMSGGVTDDTQPRLFGSATAGGIVKIYEGAVLLGQAIAGVDGKWEFTPPVGLSEGAHSLTATVTTPAKGESDRSASFELTIDFTAPNKPSIDQVYDDKGISQGALSSGQSTDDTTPTLSGKAEAGSTVRIYDNGALIGTTVADAAGNWSHTPNPQLGNGEHVFTVTAQDKAGSVSDASDGFAIVVDTIPAPPPVIETVYDDEGSKTGLLNSGDLTDDAKPTIGGSAEAHATVVIRDHGLEIGRTTADANGKWSFDPVLPMGLGAHKLTAVAIDAAGNVSGVSNQFDLTLGTPEPPAAPVITSVVDDVGSVTGNLLPNAVTDDARPTVNGNAQPGMTVSIFVDGVLVGSAVAKATGEWSITPDADLADGPHNITAKATNAQGNTSDPTAAYPIVVDTTPPPVPVPADAALWDDVGQITGQITNGTVTDDNTPTFVGTAEPNATVVVYDNGVKIGQAAVGADGTWTFTPAPALLDGAHKFNYEVVDKAGNVSGKSAEIVFDVNRQPLVIRIDGASDDAGTITGEIAKGGVTDDTTPTLHGLATAGGTVKIYEGSTLLGQAVAGSDGKWSFTPPAALAAGAHALTATVTTVTNGESARSAPFDFTVDVSAPDKPSIDKIHDDVGADKGALSHGQATDDTMPTLSGKAEAGSTVHIRDGQVVLGSVVADAAGNWTFTPAAPLLNGALDFSVTAVDKAGNVSDASDVFGIVIDTIAPDAPIIVSVYDDQGNQTGFLKSGDSTDDTKPKLTGTAEPNTVVVIKDDGHEIGRANVDANGNWECEPVLPMGLGEHKLTVQAIDAAGNTSAASDRFDLTIGNPDQPSPPAITSVIDDVGATTGNIQKDAVTDDARPTINGTAQSGMTVSVYIDDVLAGVVVAAANGNWSFTPTSDLADGLPTITATATNSLGNISPKTGEYPIVVDTTPPPAPVLADATLWDDAGTITGPITNGTTTDDSTPTFSGTAEPNATVVIYDNGVEIGRAATNASGAWTFTPSPVLVDGQHKLNYEVVDKAGNSSQKSDVIDFIVDTSKLEVSIDGATDDVGSITGAIAKGGVTDDTTPTLHGTATAGGTVKIYEGGVLLGQAIVGSDNKWTFTVPGALAAGPHALTATVTTIANGESERSAAFDFSIDVTPPDVPTIVQVFDDVGAPQGALSQGQSTDDTTPTLSGKAEANSTVHIYDNGGLLGSAAVDALGNWSFTPSPPLLNGAHAFTVAAEDKAGNLSAVSNSFVIVIDTVAPDKPVIEAVYDDHGARTGNLASGATTDDAKPTIRGSAEVGSTVIIKDGDVELGRVVAGSDGKWVFEPPAGLIDGAHKLSVEAMDAAGNLSQPSDAFDVTVDTTVPTTPKISSIRDDVGEFVGILRDGGTTDDANPTIAGTGKAGEIVEIRVDGAVLGSVVVEQNGRWVYTAEVAVLDGPHAFTAVAVSAGGAESAVSNVYNIRVDTVAPDRPVVEAVRDNAGTWMGDLQNGETTDDRTPTFVGKAEANSTIMVFDGGEEVGFADVDEGGNWTYTAERLSYGEHVFTFQAFDVAGNISASSEEWSVYVIMASRSMHGEADTVVPLSVQDLLVDEPADVLGPVPAQPSAAAAPLAVVELQASMEEGQQDSWALNSHQSQDAQAWNPANGAEAGYLMEQPLHG